MLHNIELGKMAILEIHRACFGSELRERVLNISLS